MRQRSLSFLWFHLPFTLLVGIVPVVGLAAAWVA